MEIGQEKSEQKDSHDDFTCIAMLADGSPCKCYPLHGELRCINHSESARGLEARRLRQRKALEVSLGEDPDFNLRDARSILRTAAKLMRQVLRGELDHRKASAFIALLNTALRVQLHAKELGIERETEPPPALRPNSFEFLAGERNGWYSVQLWMIPRGRNYEPF